MDHYSRDWTLLLLVLLTAEVSAWSSCSRPCGGGKQSEETCLTFLRLICDTNRRSCNEFCYNGGRYSGGCRCPAWADGYCCANCKPIDHCLPGHHSCTDTGASCDSCESLYYPGGVNKGCLYCDDIPHCVHGYQQCKVGSTQCSLCEDPYYPGGWNWGCQNCPPIDNCETVYCTVPADKKCTNCVDNNVFFKKKYADTACERMCAWNGHTCWPGVCRDELTRNCQCAPGFYRQTTRTETTCQLESSSRPDIQTCDMTVVGPGGEKKRATQTGISSECIYKGDVFGNFQPTSVEYNYLAEFKVDPFQPQPTFIMGSQFGVTDATLLLQYKDINGSTRMHNTETIRRDINMDGKSANTTVSLRNTTGVVSNLKNGERYAIPNDLDRGVPFCLMYRCIMASTTSCNVMPLCHKTGMDGMFCITFEAKAGGYLIAKDTTAKTHAEKPAVPYRKTDSSKEICYRFDDTSPEHCKLTKTCDNEYDPLYIENRVVRTQITTVYFSGWLDPIPDGGTALQASGIQDFDITVNEVSGTATLLKVTDQVSDATFNASMTSVKLNLTSSIPKLYCITLTVKDIADNSRLARRFVLYDNTSQIELRSDKSFYVSSSSAVTGYTWQTHHNDVCLDWKNYFLNIYYFANPMLSPIEPDPSGLIKSNSIYEQTSGILPVSGTPNIDGIVRFLFSWAVNGGTLSHEENVPNFQNQAFCKALNVRDGETYTLQIRAIDIVNNMYAENRTVHIDSTIPDIDHIWLTKDGYKRVYVHDSKDLSQMKLEFEARDLHSGVREVHWSFGTGDGIGELGSGNIPAITINKTTCSNSNIHCYCPHFGLCEIYNYSIGLDSLVAKQKHHGDHNRNYSFTITVTNHARLFNTEHVNILVDDSPPESGDVYEGPVDYPDIDYTSDMSFLVHWHGFIDHESGIKMYIVGMAERCLDKQELGINGISANEDAMVIREVVGTANVLKLPANFTGKRYVTVVAFNNAMASSIGVCSDGITRDISAPEIRNITIQHGRWSESIGCHEGRAWLLTTELKKLELHNISSCHTVCVNDSDTVVEMIQTRMHPNNDQDISEFMCVNLPRYNRGKIVYIPNDHISLQWDAMIGLSQIQDFYVGFGKDRSETSSPGLVEYVSTDKKQFFRRRHEGIGTDDLFYIFIKTINKAGLDRIVTVGPVLIDETQPSVKRIPNVTLTETDVVIGWENDQFYDNEQTEQINHIIIQIDQGSDHVSPVLEWRLDYSKQCPGFTGGCLTFPINRLQQQDTDLGLEFHAVLYVHNNAGHYRRVTTPTFLVPSSYPPGHAIIQDIDPEDLNMSHDTNVHFTADTMCAQWTGFKHHENISLEVGIGTRIDEGDTVPFHEINNTVRHCVRSMKITSGDKYYFSIRATCSGGQTVSSSNGVTIYSESHILDFSRVHVGDADTQQTVVISPVRNITSDSVLFTFPHHLLVGRKYCATVRDVTLVMDDVYLTSTDAVVSYMNQTATSQMFSIHSFVNIPQLYFTSMTDTVTGKEYRITLDNCPNSLDFQNSMNSIYVYWSVGVSDMSTIAVEAAAVISHCEDINATCNELLSPFVKTDTNSATTITGLTLHPGVVYKAAIRPCTSTRCLNYILSEGMMVDNLPPSGYITRAELTGGTQHTSCHTVTIEWNPFISMSGIVLYQWTVSSDDKGIRQLTPWNNILPPVTTDNNTLQVSECVAIRVHPHSSMFGCVRAHSGVGYHHTVCKSFAASNDNAYDKSTVYDFDTVSHKWPMITQMLHSGLLGKKLSVLHDAELDFGSQDSAIAGAVLYANERDITWYLMKSVYLPVSCNTDPNCIISARTSSGYVEFGRLRVPHNSVSYICAYSNATYIERETFTEIQGEIRSCSNGFVIDTIRPSGGFVRVANSNGYLVDTTEIEIHWGDFHDNVDATAIGRGTAIQQYVVSIGSMPGGDDLLSGSTYEGASTNTVIRNMSVEDGTPVFVAVTAYDYAGNNFTVISQELLVDTSCPSGGNIRLQSYVGTGRYFGSDSLSMYVTGFNDPESGIRDFRIGIGSRADRIDVMSAKTYTTDHIEFNTHLQLFHDGLTYFINVVVTNRAALSSKIVSTSFILDRSAPIGGHVIDGWQHSGKDVDYQTDTSHIRGSWRGFSDPHSGILYYRAGLGSKPYCDDVQPLVDVGLSTETLWNSTFIPGMRYYVTVEACNRVGRCMSRSSDGIVLDNSPPTPGQVRIASGVNNQKYVAHSESVHVEWAGFEDPHSGIERFDICVGTAPLACDIQSWFNCLLSSSTIKHGLHLPTNTDLYATVMATNKAGIHVKQTSARFTVDNSPPVLIRKPTFLTEYNIVHGFTVQWEKSILRTSWKFEDTDSPVVRHIITLLTHHEGHTPIEDIEIGADNKLTINLDSEQWLHNGDRYRASVTACNAAGLCATEVSDHLLIDATPPHTGGLKPHITWLNCKTDSGSLASTVSLSWYGFHDQESGIHQYYITISRTYSGQELSNGTVSVIENITSDVNSRTFNLTEPISPDDEVIISIWAENNAGLKSSTARVTVEALSTITSNNIADHKGILEIQKHSCDVHYCKKDCTCAVIGQPCVDVKGNMSCVGLNTSYIANAGLPTVDVFGGMPGEPQSITASSACLTGHWLLINGTLADVRRFEWSMGLQGQPIGDGIFDLNREMPWNDVGLRTDAIHCLPLGRSLSHNFRYVVYVRAWYENDRYSVFQSSPIVVDHTAPSIRRGEFVKDSDRSCRLDYDYVDWVDTITGCWYNVFWESQATILHYYVALGTSVNTDDVYPLTNVGLQTSFTVANVILAHGTRYYFTVTAYNTVGLHTSVSSDGFIVDTDTPLAGVVFNTVSHRDVSVQSSNTTFGMSWLGFVDHYSGIRSYHAAVIDASDISTLNSTFINVGIHKRATFKTLNLGHGATYHGVVYAVDAAGHVSNVSVSRGVLIDVTPPVGFTCRKFNTVIQSDIQKSTDPTIEITMTNSFVKDRLYKVFGDIHTADVNVQISFKQTRLFQMLPTAVNHDGTLTFEYNFLSPVSDENVVKLEVISSLTTTVRATLQECADVDFDNLDPIQVQQISDSLVSVNVQVFDKESALHKIQVGAGTTAGGFQVRALSPVRGGYNGVISAHVLHSSPVYVTVIAENYAGLRSTFHGGPIVMDHTPPEIDELNAYVDSHEHFNTTDDYDFEIIAGWKAVDKENGVKMCWCELVGPATGDADHQTAPSTDETSCNIHISDVYHGQRLFVVVTCVNAVQLSTSATSHPVVISTGKPTSDNARVEFISTDPYSISAAGMLGDRPITTIQSNGTSVHLAWTGFSDPSGLHHYEYRLLNDNHTIFDWTSTDMRTQTHVTRLHIKDGSMVTGHVRAVNHGGFQSDAIETGVIVDGREPKLSGLPVKILPMGKKKFYLDWDGVFTLNTNIPVTYSLVVGSQSGYSDLADVSFATTDTYEVMVPESSIITPEINEIHVVITCTYPTGLHAIYRTRVSV